MNKIKKIKSRKIINKKLKKRSTLKKRKQKGGVSPINYSGSPTSINDISLDDTLGSINNNSSITNYGETTHEDISYTPSSFDTFASLSNDDSNVFDFLFNSQDNN